jgi:hypothetical protein
MNNNANNNGWETTTLNSITETLEILADLRIHRRQWMFRGQPQCYENLIPSIDRKPFNNIVERDKKLLMERQSIELFRSTVRFFAQEYEKEALGTDITTLMLLQHYGAPTRLLDWSFSPYIASYFSVCNYDEKQSELWGFDYPYYAKTGGKQWEDYPETKNNGVFDNQLTVAFERDYQNNWFVCQYYAGYFPRYLAQEGGFSFTPQFGQDHAVSIREFMKDRSRYHRYIINGECKQKLRKILRDEFNIWHGSLYPDTTGAAEGIKELLQDEAGKTPL